MRAKERWLAIVFVTSRILSASVPSSIDSNARWLSRCASSVNETANSSAARQYWPDCSSARAVSCASTYETDADDGSLPAPKEATSVSSVPPAGGAAML